MSSAPAKKVLILALSGIGNFLMQSPVFAAIKKAHPAWHITAWVAPRGTKELAENNPNINAVIETPIKQSVTGHLKLISRLRREKFDIAIMLSPGQLIKGAFFMFLAGIPIRISHQYPLHSNSSSNFLVTQSIPEDPSLHDIEQNLALLKLVDIPDSYMQVTGYRLLVPTAAQQQANQLWQELGIPANKTVIGIHPGSARGFEWKRWPLEHWITLSKTLIEKHNAFILVFGGPDEQEVVEQLATALPTANRSLVGDVPGGSPIERLEPQGEAVGWGQAGTAGPTGLLATAALMQHCKLFISNDSGLMHLAAASGVPTLGLFGPTDETHTGPKGLHSHTLRAPTTQPVYNTESNSSLGAQSHGSLRALTPQFVINKIKDIGLE